MAADVQISLAVRNNRNYPLPINILGSPVNLLDTANAYTEYRYTFTGFTFTNQNSVSVQYKPKSASNFSTFTGILQSQTLQGVVDILNQLGIGYFNLYTELGQTYISTNNDNYVFGNVNVFNNASPIYTPNALYDFNQSGVYNNGLTIVPDVSGNGNNGTGVVGTGNGTAVNLSNFPYVAPSSIAGYLNMPSSPSNQYSVALPNAYKFSGIVPYTMMIWFQSTDASWAGNPYQGLISAEGRNPAAIGYNFFFTNAGGYQISSQRFNLSTGVPDVTSCILTNFTANIWMFALCGYDGTNMYLGIYDAGGNYIVSQTPSAASLDTSPAYAAFMGLRYNNWLNGQIGYAAIYTQWTGYQEFLDIYNSTKANYGY